MIKCTYEIMFICMYVNILLYWYNFIFRKSVYYDVFKTFSVCMYVCMYVCMIYVSITSFYHKYDVFMCYTIIA